jgi:hypothetical protein
MAMNSTCLVRIGLEQVSAVWFDAGDRRPARKAVAPLARETAPNVSQTAQSVAAAIDEALTAAAPNPGRMLFGFDLSRLGAVHVRVAIADPYLRSALMKFAKLPASGADRALLISERFSREHKLEKAVYEVAASLVEITETQQTLLCCAIPRRLIGAIREQLAAHNLHADFIAPELLFGLQGSEGQAGAGGVMLIYPDYATLALRNDAGAMVHMVTLRRGRQSPNEFVERLTTRLTRYSVLLRAEERPLTLDMLADAGEPQEIAQALAHGLAHLPVTLVDGRRNPAGPQRTGVMAALKKMVGKTPPEPEPFWQAMLMGAP